MLSSHQYFPLIFALSQTLFQDLVFPCTDLINLVCTAKRFALQNVIITLLLAMPSLI